MKGIQHAGLRLDPEQGVHFHANEVLAWGVLAEDAEIEGLPCRAGEEVEFHPEGRLASALLAAPWTVRGLPARGGTPIAFYPDGSLRFLALAQPRRIAGFPAGAGNTFFHPDGRVWSAVSSAEVDFGDEAVPAGTRVTIGPDGRLLEWWRALAVDTEIQGIPCSARFPVWFYAGGRLSCLHLARPCRVDGRRLATETELVLEPDGSLRETYTHRYPRSGEVAWRVFGAIEEPLFG
jgi:hypothetical protein